MSTKIESAIYTNNEKLTKETIFYESLDKSEYEEKYKGNLTCVNGCKARIKFTHRKDNSKFFSTWNKEGELHDKYCQYHVNYKGKMGRKKLKGMYEDVEVDTKHIKDTIKRKIMNLKNLHNSGTVKPDKLTTIKIENDGAKEVTVGVDGKPEDQNTKKSIHIGSLDAEHLDPSYVDTRKCVYGYIENVQLRENESKQKYAYLNLKNTRHNVSVYLPEGFYAKENNSVSKLEKFMSIMKARLETDMDYLFIGVGFITSKKKDGINIVILDKEHFVINEREYEDILNSRLSTT